MQYAVVFLAGVVIVLIALGVRSLKSNRKPREVLDNLGEFIKDFEAENDRFVEMVSHLRKKMDEENLNLNNRLNSLSNENRRLGDRLQILERSQFSGSESPSMISMHREPPAFLSPKYREVAMMLIDGKDTQIIAKELGIGRGEVDFVSRLLESERDGQ